MLALDARFDKLSGMLADPNASAIEQAIAHFQKGERDIAERLCREVLVHDASNVGALELLGVMAREAGRNDDAAGLMRKCIAIRPDVADYHNTLGSVLLRMSRYDEAIVALEKAVYLRPAYPEARLNLAVGYQQTGSFAKAESTARQAIASRAGYAAAFIALAEALCAQGKLSEAIDSLASLLRTVPTPEIADRLASLLLQAGRVDEAIVHYRRAVELNPNDPAVQSNLLFALQYDPRLSPAEIFQEHRKWAARHESGLAGRRTSHSNNRNPNRRLRVGYVSADFREHTRARFVEPLLRHHDHNSFEVICYSDVVRPDSITARLRGHADIWRETANLSHEQLADLIELDRVDILVDLTGHMGGNRLPVFALRPAPVQVAYPGYPATTGLDGIDYLLTDQARDPIGSQQYYSEKLIYLEPSSQCYWPGDEREMPEVGPLPCLKAGRVTFGSLNKAAKLNETVLDAWAQILLAVEGSRIVLLAEELDAEGRPRSSAVDHFAQRGIARSRIGLIGRCSRRAYLALHNSIDIGLDPWPYNGHTTTLDAIWMGVPVVALEGNSHLSRESAAAMRLAGLLEFVVSDADEYVQSAARMARNAGVLTRARATLRTVIRKTLLCNAPNLIRLIEDIYRALWFR